MTNDMTHSRGLYPRYKISKTDGTPVDKYAEYFVLRLDSGGGDPHHIAACRRAIRVYADEIAPYLPQLAADLRAKYAKPDKQLA